MGQADYSAAAVGMAVAKVALEALGKLLGDVGDDQRFLQEISGTLARFATTLPTFDAGIRLDRLRTASDLEIEARTFANAGTWSLSRLIPRCPVTAWRLSQSESLLNLLMQLSAARNATDREGLAKRIDETVATTANQTVRDSIPYSCLNAVKSEEFLHQIYVAIDAGVELQNRRITDGLFPQSAASLSVSLDKEGLRYESFDGGKGYRILIGQGDGAITIVEQRSFNSRKSAVR